LPPPGALTGPLRAGVYDVGDFRVVWTPDVGLEIVHRSEPERWLWASPPRAPFLRAADGDATVREARGMFWIRDRLRAISTTQSVTTIEADDGVLELTGCLDERPYIFRLWVEDDLRFCATVPGADRVLLCGRSAPDARILGFGEQFTHVDCAGRRVPILSQEQGIGRGRQPLTWVMNALFGAGGDAHTTYVAVPFYLTSASRALSLDTTAYCEFDLRTSGEIAALVHAESLTGRILHGGTPAELIEAHTRQAGRMPSTPTWLDRGAVIGMQGGTAAVRKMHATLKAAGVPVAAYWLQDWVGKRKTAIGSQLWWDWRVCKDTYPGWDQLVADMRADGARVLTYINPFLVDRGSGLFQEAAERGLLVRDETGAPYQIPNTSFSAALLDLTAPGAEDWIKGVIKERLIGSGASGWMADYGEALPFDAKLADGRDAPAYHNQYPVDWARINREAIAEAGLEGEALFFCRSGHTQSPRHATMMWLGDQLPTWDRHDGLRSALAGLLSGGLSGFALNHTDVGGYTTVAIPGLRFPLPLVGAVRGRELLARWTELSAFTAMLRTHEGSQPKRNHQIDADAETLAHFARFARVYAALADYRRGLLAQAAARGLPIVRHMALEFPDAPAAWGLTRQFMLGPDLLVAPALGPGVQRVRVWLPSGRWRHVWMDTLHEAPAAGAWQWLDAPVGQPAVLARAGCPTGEALRDALAASDDLAPLPTRPPDRARMAAGGVLGLAGFFGLVALCGTLLREPMTAVAVWAVETFGFAGLFAYVLMVDAVPTPLSYAPVMLLAIQGGLAAWTVLALSAGASVLAGLVGFSLGRLVGMPERLRHWIAARWPRMLPLVQRHGALGVAGVGMAPLPFGLATWSAGALGVRFLPVAAACLVRVPKTAVYVSLIVGGLRMGQ